jgi:outer membrane protein assembly factor BamA
MNIFKSLLVLQCLMVGSLASAQVIAETNAAAEEDKKTESPWLIAPLLSANPKLDTAAGAMVAYIHKFDELSRTSLFGLQAQYSTSDSIVAGLFGRASFDEDHHRVTAGIVFGNVNNDYSNYLETGQTVDTQDRIRSAFTRYLYRIKGNLFIGLQGAFTNYELVGKSEADDTMLDNLGLVGYKSGGLGFSILYDSRDNDFKTTKGWYLNANSISYREAIAGDANFDIYRSDIRYFIPHGNNNVLGFRQRNQWSVDAPPGAYSPIYLRGYTPGEFLAQNMSSLEIEERLFVAERWTANLFAGIAFLYGDGSSTLSDDSFPSAGLGIQYILKPKEGMVANLEYAQGQDDSHGLYLNMGYSF